MQIANPIIVALDTPQPEQAEALAQQLAGHVGCVKLGLEFFVANGPAGVRRIVETGVPANTGVFLDLKFYDIPNTVAGAVREATRLGCRMLTLHASGGPVMLQAAREAAAETAEKAGTQPPLLLGVTMLTSMDAAQIAAAGYTGSAEENVLRLAALARESGVDGLVCSPQEVQAVRQAVGKDMVLVTPGIRPEGSARDDQSRIMTPSQALAAGADYLVIGRPITQAENPGAAAEAIQRDIMRRQK